MLKIRCCERHAACSVWSFSALTHAASSVGVRGHDSFSRSSDHRIMRIPLAPDHDISKSRASQEKADFADYIRQSLPTPARLLRSGAAAPPRCAICKHTSPPSAAASTRYKKFAKITVSAHKRAVLVPPPKADLRMAHVLFWACRTTRSTILLGCEGLAGDRNEDLRDAPHTHR